MSKTIIRRATLDDAEVILEWRNDETTRMNSFSKEKIELDSHIKWFKRKLSEESCALFMLMDEDEAVGHIRIDRVNDIGEISYMIAPQKRGKGYGKMIINRCEGVIPEEINVLMGMVNNENEPSRKCFISNGYAEFSGGYKLLY